MAEPAATAFGAAQAARLAVLGSPISHSRSPRIHAAAYDALHLNWRYEAIECRESELAKFVAGLGAEWRGLSITMPLKREAHALSAQLDPAAQLSGVVNTLVRRDGASGWAGFNTDVSGLAAAIAEVDLDASRTLLLGSGATAVSAILAARELGAQEISVQARNHAAVSQLSERFGVAPRDETHGTAPTLVISTLPGPVGSTLDLPVDPLRTPLFDVSYDPWPSPLAQRWRDSGGNAHSGLGMLLHQALFQVRIFVHGDPSRELEREPRVFAAMRSAAGFGSDA